MPKNQLKEIGVFDLDKLQENFFRNYNPDYWKYKIILLKNSHDYYDDIKDKLADDQEEIDDEYCKRVIRTELHFLYFQMIETLFETIFAICEHENRDLWLALTFSNDRETHYYSDCYTKIKKFANGNLQTPDLWSKIDVKIKDKPVKIQLLRWIFYYHYSSKMSDEDWKINLNKIHSLLKTFAKDFSDRGEYNAYKHSLRFFTSPSYFAMVENGSNTGVARKSEDSIIYIEESKEQGSLNFKPIVITSKPFDFYRDYVCCLIIYHFLKNIINTRKYTFLENLHEEKFKFATFLDVKIPEDITPKTGFIKSKFPV
jgi:hypothetical protein